MIPARESEQHIAAEPAVLAERISVSYQAAAHVVHALDDVTVSLDAGRWTALVGPSGSGKSTLLQVIGGLQRPSTGSISVCGVSLERLDRSRVARFRLQHVGFVFQAFHLLPYLAAWENVALPLIAAGIAPAERRARALELLADVKLAHRVHHRPTELSGGEQQRVALARALANRPGLIVADELTGNLDAANAQSILDLLAKFVEGGTTVVCATHDRTVAQRADFVVELRHGHLALESSRE